MGWAGRHGALSVGPYRTRLACPENNLMELMWQSNPNPRIARETKMEEKGLSPPPHINTNIAWWPLARTQNNGLCPTAAAAAKSLQSCLTLCNSTDGSPPGSPVPGILQARTLEWVAMSFSNAWKWKVKVKLLSRVQLLATHGLQPTRLLHPWDFPGKNTGMACHFLLQWIFLTQGSNPHFLCLLHWLVDSLLLRHLGSPSTHTHTHTHSVCLFYPIIQSVEI